MKEDDFFKSSSNSAGRANEFDFNFESDPTTNALSK